jgi:hypothetical protein
MCNDDQIDGNYRRRIVNKGNSGVKKAEALNKLNEVLRKDFLQFGFHANKNKSIYRKKDGAFAFNFEIHITPKMWQHLTLSVENREIEKIFTMMEAKTLNEYSERNINAAKMPVCVLTDWKQIYMDNDLAPGKIWFTIISDFEEIKKRKDEYLLAIKLSTQWFEKCTDLDFVYKSNLNQCFTRTIEMALCAGKILGKDLNCEYKEFIAEKGKLPGWDRGEVDIFFKHIKDF